MAGLIDKARQKAAQMGCNAIFITGADKHPGAPPGSGWALFVADSELLYATCVEWLEPPAPVTVATTLPAPITVSATAHTPVAPATP